jgi:hypothetical protein
LKVRRCHSGAFQRHAKALREGCSDFTTLDAELVKSAAREVAGGVKAKPVVTKL